MRRASKFQAGPARQTAIEAAPLPAEKISSQVPSYLRQLVAAVEEGWEPPEPGQYDHAYQGYLDDLLAPIEMMEEERAGLEVDLRAQVQRMIEIAPAFFEKALRRTPYETGYFIEGAGDDD